MNDFQTTIDALQGLNRDVRHVQSILNGVQSELSAALSALGQLPDDANANNGETDIRSAQQDIRQSVAGWLNDYLRRSDDLCHRIAA